jgi:hypothetical protein
MMFTRLLLAVCLLASSACVNNGSPDGDDDGDGTTPTPACAALAGSWVISGVCGADLCSISQTGCTLTQVSCTSGSHSTSGTVNGSQFMYTGESGGGADATCSGTATGGMMSGTCTVAGGGTCSFSGSKM